MEGAIQIKFIIISSIIIIIIINGSLNGVVVISVTTMTLEMFQL